MNLPDSDPRLQPSLAAQRRAKAVRGSLPFSEGGRWALSPASYGWLVTWEGMDERLPLRLRSSIGV